MIITFSFSPELYMRCTFRLDFFYHRFKQKMVRMVQQFISIFMLLSKSQLQQLNRCRPVLFRVHVYVPTHKIHYALYNDVIMSAMASQITSLTIVYSTIYSSADQRKRESSASLAFVRGLHRWPMNSPHKWPVTRKMFPFDDVIMGMIVMEI